MSQICDELIIPSKFCDRFVTNAINKKYCIIHFFYIFINIKIIKKNLLRSLRLIQQLIGLVCDLINTIESISNI